MDGWRVVTSVEIEWGWLIGDVGSQDEREGALPLMEEGRTGDGGTAP